MRKHPQDPKQITYNLDDWERLRKTNKIQYANVKTVEAVEVFTVSSIVENLAHDGPLPVLTRTSLEEQQDIDPLAMSFTFEQKLSAHSKNVRYNIEKKYYTSSPIKRVCYPPPLVKRKYPIAPLFQFFKNKFEKTYPAL